MISYSAFAWFVLGSYLTGGVLFATLSPIADDIQDKERHDRERCEPAWKRFAFGITTRVVALLLWPFLIPSALSIRRERIEFRRPEGDLVAIADLMSKLSAGGISADAFPNGRGRFGFDLSNPIPAHTLFGARQYLDQLRTLDDRRVISDRLGSFGSDVSEKPVDGYRLSTEEGAALGVIYISPYQAKTSERPPSDFKLSGALSKPAHDGRDGGAPPMPAKRKILTIDAAKLKGEILGPKQLYRPEQVGTEQPIAESEAAQVNRRVTDESPASLKQTAKKGSELAATPASAETEAELDQEDLANNDAVIEVFRPRDGRFLREPAPGETAEPVGRAAGREIGRSAFEFANGEVDTTKFGWRMYRLGEARGRTCVEAMREAVMAHEATGGAATARAIAIRRGYLSVGLDRGMHGMVDGADPLFDEYRAAFMRGVEYAIDRET